MKCRQPLHIRTKKGSVWVNQSLTQSLSESSTGARVRTPIIIDYLGHIMNSSCNLSQCFLWIQKRKRFDLAKEGEAITGTCTTRTTADCYHCPRWSRCRAGWPSYWVIQGVIHCTVSLENSAHCYYFLCFFFSCCILPRVGRNTTDI